MGIPEIILGPNGTPKETLYDIKEASIYLGGEMCVMYLGRKIKNSDFCEFENNA